MNTVCSQAAVRACVGAAVFLLVVVTALPASATNHFNLESGIPTTIEDVEPTEIGTVELQGFARYLRTSGARNVRQLEPRLAFGIAEDTQLEVATPLLVGSGLANGNGDVETSLLRKLVNDRAGEWPPGFAVAADVRLPTGVTERGYANGLDAGVTAILKKDVGPPQFPLQRGVRLDRGYERARGSAKGRVRGHRRPRRASDRVSPARQ